MAIRYSGVNIGTFTLCQPSTYIQDGKLLNELDEKGRPVMRKFPIQIRLSNVLMCAVHNFKEENPKDPERPWITELILFFMDQTHLKRCLKEGDFEYWFSGKLRNIKLNLYYKDAQTIAKYMTQTGLSVKCYYKEPKKCKPKVKVTTFSTSNG